MTVKPAACFLCAGYSPMFGIASFFAQPLGEASNCGARSHDAFVFMYIYIRPKQLLTPPSLVQ